MCVLFLQDPDGDAIIHDVASMESLALLTLLLAHARIDINAPGWVSLCL